MNYFKDFDIKPTKKNFVGDKINEEYLINREVTVHDFIIGPSKYNKENPDKKCLHLQLTIEGVKRVFFTGSEYLMDMIQRVPSDKFPFQTKIIKENKRLLFS